MDPKRRNKADVTLALFSVCADDNSLRFLEKNTKKSADWICICARANCFEKNHPTRQLVTVFSSTNANKALFKGVNSSWDEFHPEMTWISSRDDFHLGVWSFTFECLHDLEQKCVRPGMISSRIETHPGLK